MNIAAILNSKFEDFEYTPRTEAWTGIQDATVLASTFENFQHNPSSQVWDRIESELHPFKRRLIPIWWAVAAGLALLVGLGLYFTFGNQRGLDPSLVIAPVDSLMAPVPPLKGVRGMLSTSETPELDRFGVDKQGRDNPELDKLGRHIPLTPFKGGVGVDIPLAKGGVGEDIPVAGTGIDIPLVKADIQSGTPINTLKTPALALQGKSLQDLLQSKLSPAEPSLPDWAKDDWPLPPEIDNPGNQKNIARGLETRIGSNIAPTFASVGGSLADSPLDNTGTFIGTGNGSLESTPFATLDEAESHSEDFSTPYIFGILLHKRLGKRWSIGSGFVYTLMNSTAYYQSEEWLTNYKISRQYAGIPLTANFNFVQKKRFGVYLSSGVQFDFGLQEKVQEENRFSGELVSETTNRGRLPNQASVNLGMGLDYHLGKRTSLYFQGSGAHYFYKTHYNLWIEKKVWPTLQVGLRIGL